MEQREKPPQPLRCSGQDARFLPSACLPLFLFPLAGRGACLTTAGALIPNRWVHGRTPGVLAPGAHLSRAPGKTAPGEGQVSVQVSSGSCPAAGGVPLVPDPASHFIGCCWEAERQPLCSPPRISEGCTPAAPPPTAARGSPAPSAARPGSATLLPASPARS